MARRYKPLPAGQIVWLRIGNATVRVISDDGAGLVLVLREDVAADYQLHLERGAIRLATPAEVEAHSLKVAGIGAWRRVQAEHERLLATLAELAAAANVVPTPAEPAG